MLEQNMQACFHIIIGQCTPAMVTKLEGHSKYQGVKQDMTAIDLLLLLKEMRFDFQSQKFPAQALHEAYIRFFKCCMDATMTPQTYLEKFKNHDRR
jgi:hypothetical protein